MLWQHNSTVLAEMAPKRAQNTSARVDAIKALRTAAQTQLKALRSDLKKAAEPLRKTHCILRMFTYLQPVGNGAVFRGRFLSESCAHGLLLLCDRGTH